MRTRFTCSSCKENADIIVIAISESPDITIDYKHYRLLTDGFFGLANFNKMEKYAITQ